jgi:hypothetical protein
MATLDPPVPDRLWPGALRLACGPTAIGSRTRSHDGRCNWVLCGPVCGLGKEWRGAPDPGGSAAVTPACGSPCTERSPAVSKVAQGVRRNAPKGDGGVSWPCRRRGPNAPGDWSPHDSLTGFPRVAGSKGHAPRGDGRRGEVGAGASAATAARRWCWRPSQCGNERIVGATAYVRQRACKVATSRCKVGRDGTSQRGSRWSPARRHVRRRARRSRSVRASARGFTTGGWARSGRPRTWCPPSSPTRYGAQGSQPRRGRGGAVRSSTAAASYARGKGQGSTWPPRDRYGRVLGCTVMRASGWRNRACERKREHERVRLGAASRARQASHDGHDDTRKLGYGSGAR